MSKLARFSSEKTMAKQTSLLITVVICWPVKVFDRNHGPLFWMLACPWKTCWLRKLACFNLVWRIFLQCTLTLKCLYRINSTLRIGRLNTPEENYTVTFFVRDHESDFGKIGKVVNGFLKKKKHLGSEECGRLNFFLTVKASFHCRSIFLLLIGKPAETTQRLLFTF